MTDASGRTALRPGQILLGLAFTIGLVLRIAPVLGTDFPLGDGGLFATMAHDIRQAHFALPQYSSFNAGNVPFAYPPLGLYLLAGIPGDPISTERWLPLVYSMLAIGAAYLLARELLDETSAALATLVFAVMPITWIIDGGGVTRALGLGLLLLAVWRAAVLLRSPTVTNTAAAGVVAGIALLSHPAVGPTGVVSVAVLFAFGPSRRRFATLVGASLIAALVILPWVTMVLLRYGGTAFLTAAATPHGVGHSILLFLTVGPSWMAPLDFVVPAAVLGGLVLAKRRDWLLPAWVVLLLVLPDASAGLSAIVWAMLAAAGLMAIVPLLEGLRAIRLAAGVGLAWAVIGPFMSGYPAYFAIPPEVRAVMVAAGNATPPGTTFAIVSVNAPLRGIALDWFPTLTHRVSLGTYQGLEWTTKGMVRDAMSRDSESQTGRLPSGTDAIFTISGDAATWALVHH